MMSPCAPILLCLLCLSFAFKIRHDGPYEGPYEGPFSEDGCRTTDSTICLLIPDHGPGNQMDHSEKDKKDTYQEGVGASGATGVSPVGNLLDSIRTPNRRKKIFSYRQLST